MAWSIVQEWLPERYDTPPGTKRYPETLVLQEVAAALADEAGDRTAARMWLEAHDRWVHWGGSVLGRPAGEQGWSQYHRQAGDMNTAREHAERALAYASEPRQPLALLAAHRLLGELDTDASRFEYAKTHLDTALTLADACAAPYERAATLLALAELQAAARDNDAARVSLEKVRAICTRLGANPMLARADALTERIATQSFAAPNRPAGLSAREVEVLQLVAAGLTNVQVAERLYLSPRTVEQHLRSIYGKLGVSTRTAATHFAFTHGLN